MLKELEEQLNAFKANDIIVFSNECIKIGHIRYEIKEKFISPVNVINAIIKYGKSLGKVPAYDIETIYHTVVNHYQNIQEKFVMAEDLYV